MTDLAVVGIGSWGQNLVRNFAELGTVRTCCHTGNPENEAWLAEHYPDVELTTDYDAVLADDGIDAVAVATPIGTLADVAGRALEAGKHVYVEKPMAPTREAAEELVALADESDRTLFVGYIFVHHPITRRLVEHLEDDPPRHLAFEWKYVGSFGPDIVNNLACHPVSVATALAGGPTADVTVTRDQAVTGDTDVLSATLEYGDATCDLDVNRLSPLETSISATAITEGGEAYVLRDDSLVRFDHDAEAFETIDEPDAEPLADECRNFLECVETGRDPVTDGAFGVEVHHTLEALKAEL